MFIFSMADGSFSKFKSRLCSQVWLAMSPALAPLRMVGMLRLVTKSFPGALLMSLLTLVTHRLPSSHSKGP